MKELWKGNEAIAEAAVRAGCRLYIGYPITPQSEIVEYMSTRMPELGRVFIQSESELISINTVFGASLTGARCMTSSSGVGISLMQEGLTACFAKGLCPLIINVNRSGNGMGGGTGFAGCQDDYTRETHGGGNGYYRYLVYIPSSIQEAVDMTYVAWDIAEKYRNPVEIYTEGRLGQMMEAVEFPDFKTPDIQAWGIDGTTKPMPEYHTMMAPSEYGLFAERIRRMEENEQSWESWLTEDAETVIIAVGLCSRVCRGVIARLRAEGKKIGMLRPKAVWPFPLKGFAALPGTVKKLICVENSDGQQMLEDVLVATKKLPDLQQIPVYSNAQMGLISSYELRMFLAGVEDGSIKEVY
ncbi:3-methyl-2-oxobutanoate dehydrogenase subunit beta [Lachnospiraceae bacterium ZAX-1]